MRIGSFVSVLLWIFLGYQGMSQVHPNLIITKGGLQKINKKNSTPLFSDAINQATTIVNKAIEDGIKVPIPVDMAGGYTHEIHKGNYINMQLAGNLYQINGDKKYAIFIKSMLMEYAKIYKDLPIHPTNRSYSTGKIFWQCLNDANWMVYTAQAYDCIYNFLTAAERQHLESNLFRPFADFISIENPQFFNRVHNHSTWGNAAVGMIGLAMHDEELIQRSLYGIKDFKIDVNAKDNDGGYIYDAGKISAGFFAQIDNAFSPDGYYNEGPYYQRYALLPFIVFAGALHQNRPELKIFEYRDSILLKSVKTLMQQTNTAGEFFPINDAQKGMSINAESLINVLNIAYGISGDKSLLPYAKIQGSVTPDPFGYLLAQDLQKSKNLTANYPSLYLSDGKNGDEGALMILRSQKSKKKATVAFKCTSQGLGHGHYDKLSYSIYLDDKEVLQDYGAARWVNIDQKAGGRYLPENDTWAKQTIAHNTLIMDKKSHYNGIYELANENHSDPIYFQKDVKNVQLASAKDIQIYPGSTLNRSVAIWEDDAFEYPFIFDIFTVESKDNHTYDLPFQHAGQVLKTSFKFKASNLPTVMGDGHGYQHVYNEGSVLLKDSSYSINWMKDNNFYTLTAISNLDDEIIFGRLGANDPNFNLRRDPLFIHQKKNQKDAIFLSVIEPHGTYSTVTEVPLQPYSNISALSLIYHDKENVIFEMKTMNQTYLFMWNRINGDKNIMHKIEDKGNTYMWEGPFSVKKIKL